MVNRLRDHWRQKDLDDKFQAKQKDIVVLFFLIIIYRKLQYVSLLLPLCYSY